MSRVDHSDGWDSIRARACNGPQDQVHFITRCHKEITRTRHETRYRDLHTSGQLTPSHSFHRLHPASLFCIGRHVQRHAPAPNFIAHNQHPDRLRVKKTWLLQSNGVCSRCHCGNYFFRTLFRGTCEHPSHICIQKTSSETQLYIKWSGFLTHKHTFNPVIWSTITLSSRAHWEFWVLQMAHGSYCAPCLTHADTWVLI